MKNIFSNNNFITSLAYFLFLSCLKVINLKIQLKNDDAISNFSLFFAILYIINVKKFHYLYFIMPYIHSYITYICKHACIHTYVWVYAYVRICMCFAKSSLNVSLWFLFIAKTETVILSRFLSFFYFLLFCFSCFSCFSIFFRLNFDCVFSKVFPLECVVTGWSEVPVCVKVWKY